MYLFIYYIPTHVSLDISLVYRQKKKKEKKDTETETYRFIYINEAKPRDFVVDTFFN